MLALQKSASHHGKTTPNVLPCRINHNGPVDASKRYWNPRKSADDKTTTSYFRGRKLHARSVKLPKGYRGVVLTATDRVLRSREQELARRRRDEEGEPRDGEEEEEEEVKILEEQASFEEVLVWGHEAVVDVGEDAYVRGVEEWIGFAESIHAFEPIVSVNGTDAK